MFSCKICKEKDLRISELKDQIIYFKSILNPPPKINTYELEESVMMNGGGQEEIDPATVLAEEKENAIIQREVDFIFSGNSEVAEG